MTYARSYDFYVPVCQYVLYTKHTWLQAFICVWLWFAPKPSKIYVTFYVTFFVFILIQTNNLSIWSPYFSWVILCCYKNWLSNVYIRTLLNSGAHIYEIFTDFSYMLCFILLFSDYWTLSSQNLFSSDYIILQIFRSYLFMKHFSDKVLKV